MADPNQEASKPSERTAADIHATRETEHPTDARLARLSTDILPQSPHILTSQGPLYGESFRQLYPQNDINWRRYSPFKPGEEDLQHASFHDRPDYDEFGMMFARTGWDDGNGNLAAPGTARNRTSNGGTPHQGQPPRKKITLAEYTSKDRTKTTAPAQKAATSEPKDGAVSDSKVGNETKTSNVTSKLQEEDHRGQKRPAEAMNDNKESETTGHSSSLPSPKKARTPDEPKTANTPIIDVDVAQKSQAEASVGNLDAGSQKDMPHAKKTSEDNAPPATEKIQQSTNQLLPKESKKPDLPPMLSPLSSVVEEEIAKFNKKKVQNEGTIDQPAAATPQNKPETSATKSQDKKEQTFTPNKKPKNADSKIVTTPKTTAHEHTSSSKATLTPTSKSTPPERRKLRLCVALKIKKKANRKVLLTYLNLKPTPGRNSLFSGRSIDQEQRSAVPPASMDKPSDTDHDQMKSRNRDPKVRPSETSRSGGKRRRSIVDDDESEPEPSSKRKQLQTSARSEKPKAGEKRPRSVVDEAEDEPKPPSKRKQRTESFKSEKPRTPTSGRKSSPAPGSSTMLRAASGQAFANTPQPSAAAVTPTAPSTGRPRQHYTSPHKPKSPNLQSESKNFVVTATKLKHNADKFLKNAAANEEEVRKGLVIATESVLCFMFGFALWDTGLHYSDGDRWKSILPYLQTLQDRASDMSKLRHLFGLLHQLEGIIHDQIAYSDLQLLSNDDSTGIVKEKVKELHRHTMKAQAAWRAGWVELDVEDISELYTETWEKRARHRFAFGKGRCALKRNEYECNYILPMNNMTSGLEAVNFGMNFLKEWSLRNEVTWEPLFVLKEESE